MKRDWQKGKGFHRSNSPAPKDGEFQFRYARWRPAMGKRCYADRYIPNEFGEDNCLVSTVSADNSIFEISIFKRWLVVAEVH